MSAETVATNHRNCRHDAPERERGQDHSKETVAAVVLQNRKSLSPQIRPIADDKAMPRKLAKTKAARGRPRSEREPGAAAKVLLWLEATGEPNSVLTKAKRRTANSEELPSPKTLRTWLLKGIPRKALPILARHMQIDAALLRDETPLEHFRRQLADMLKSRDTLLPTRHKQPDGLRDLKAEMNFNGNVPKVLRTLIQAPADLSIDVIADRLNIAPGPVRRRLPTCCKSIWSASLPTRARRW